LVAWTKLHTLQRLWPDASVRYTNFAAERTSSQTRLLTIFIATLRWRHPVPSASACSGAFDTVRSMRLAAWKSKDR